MHSQYANLSVFDTDVLRIVNASMQVAPHLRQSKPSLLVGGPKTGLKFHFHAAGWNVVLRGSKRWLAFPSVGNHSPFNVMYHPHRTPMDTRDWLIHTPISTQRQAYQCMQRSGDVVVIPSGWLHSVINTDTTVAMVAQFW